MREWIRRRRAIKRLLRDVAEGQYYYTRRLLLPAWSPGYDDRGEPVRQAR